MEPSLKHQPLDLEAWRFSEAWKLVLGFFSTFAFFFAAA
jgi:hypothetical protein